MREILQHLFGYQYLNRQEAREVLGQISEGRYNQAQVSAFLTVFQMRSISVEELSGFRDCLQERCLTIDLSEFDPVDLCGTGGDGKNTFNISTLASFVTAGAGVKVAKHGNYGVSSASGSSNVMEYLGYRFTNDPDTIRRQMEKAGICFLHAPLFHPAMKEVAPIRKNLGVRTFFNMLGPMVNPGFPKKQLVGVFSLELQRYYKYIYEQEDIEYRIIHAFDGYDEISLTGNARVFAPEKEYLLSSTDLIQRDLKPEEIEGGPDVPTAAGIFTNILNGSGTEAQNQVVAANAALAIQCYHPGKPLTECMEMALESIYSGKAKSVLEKLLAI
jgi:anthranilate phosphoribosyltransferase